MIYVRNDKKGLEFIKQVLTVYPDYKYRSVYNTLRQSNGMQFMEI